VDLTVSGGSSPLGRIGLKSAPRLEAPRLDVQALLLFVAEAAAGTGVGTRTFLVWNVSHLSRGQLDSFSGRGNSSGARKAISR
jgi:hypothetical protein